MESNLFSFKILINDIKLNPTLIFTENYQEITNPIIALKLFNFPILHISSSNSLKSDNKINCFETGRSTLFKFSNEELIKNLEKNPLKIFFLDSNQEKNINKIIGKCMINLNIFINEIQNCLESDEENFKRHIFKLYDEKRSIIALIDISLSLVRRNLNFINRKINEKVEKINEKKNNFFQKTLKKEENIVENAFLGTFGTKPGVPLALNSKFNSKNSLKNDISPLYNQNTNVQYDKNAEKQNEFNDLLFRNSKKPSDPAFITIDKFNTIQVTNPSLKIMVEGNYCPPIMYLEKKKEIISSNNQQNIQYHYDNYPNSNYYKTIEKNNIDIQNEITKSPKKTNLIDELISELLTLKSQKYKHTPPPISSLRTSNKYQKTRFSNHEKTDNNHIHHSFENKENKENKDKNSLIDEYPDDFENISIEKHEKNQIIKTEENYSEDFESYTVSQSQNLKKNENNDKSFSDSHSQSNSQKIKMAHCYLCQLNFEASKAGEHLKSCKKNNMRYSNNTRKTKENVSASIKSIEEEEEIQKPVSSTSKIGKSDDYIEDFESFTE